MDPDLNKPVSDGQAEPSRKRAHPSGQSERTISRKKLALKKLEAQGFLTLQNFYGNVAEKKEQKARLDASVAAAASKFRSMQKKPDNQEEEESEHNIKTTCKLHNHKHTLEPEASKGMVQLCGSDGVATSCVIEIDPEPVEIKDSDDEVEIQSDPSGNASSSGPPESKHMEHIQAAKNLESCSPIPVEELEESSSCTASSNDGESDSKRAPSMVVKHGLDDAQAVVARILEERCHGNLDSTG
jgi:hypothetical protein